MKDSNGNEQRSNLQAQFFSLPKLIYVTSATFLVYGYLCRYGKNILIGSMRTYDAERWVVLARYAFPAIVLLYILTMLIALFFFRPMKFLFSWRPTVNNESNSIFYNISTGLAGGIIASLVASPLLHPQKNAEIGAVALQIADAISPRNVLILTPFILTLLIVSLAVCTELFFRGVVFRILVEYANVPAAIVSSSLLFAYLWPIFNPAVGIIFGIVFAILYYRTRTLLSSIIANAFAITFASVFFMILHRVL